MIQANMRRMSEEAAFRSLNDALVYEFFAVFSRFEYALKNGGYLSVWTVPARSGEEKQHHAPNWRLFARNTEHKYQRARCDSQSAFFEATTYILSEPPKVEVAIQETNGRWKIDFVPSQPNLGSDWCDIIEYVNRARNNLFHGRKYIGGPYDPTRDEKLLTNTLAILRTCVTWQSRVHDLYRELK